MNVRSFSRRRFLKSLPMREALMVMGARVTDTCGAQGKRPNILHIMAYDDTEPTIPS